MSNQYYVRERVPSSPFLNQNFYIVFSFPNLANGTFTGAYCSLASVISPILASGGSFAAFYPAGSVPVGTFNIYSFMVKGATGTFTTGPSITIQDSEIAEPIVTVYNFIKNNLAGTFASTVVTTGWYDTNARYPMVTVTSGQRTDNSSNLSDTFRQHGEIVYVDTWVSSRDTGAQLFGTTSKKRARKLLDDEVKRIINANRKSPAIKLRFMQIRDSTQMDEISENRRMFRTRHAIRITWDETI